MKINKEKLISVLSVMCGQTIARTDYQTKSLKGGKISDVCLITGAAEAESGEKLPYEVILKVVRKWNNPVDPDSWRREYDLYKSNFGELFTDTFRWPECFHAEMNEEENEIQMWMEYIGGVSGHDLTVEMFEQTAYEVGRLEGRLYAEQPPVLQSITNFSKADIKKKYYLDGWKNFFIEFTSSNNRGIPEHLMQLVVAMDESMDDLWNRAERLPVVLSHRDVWMQNIFISDGKVVLIDWDRTGWGYLGEDIISLIAVKAKVENIIQYYEKCYPAYRKGFMEYADISHIPSDLIASAWAFISVTGLAAQYMIAETQERQEAILETLQKICEIKTLNYHDN